ncbi:hypothetical protein F5051DRAFT_172201 [Lentinula edodes]|nr:hypothetical protein F5051DRAFT_172201 [Lentinula edodes]
MEAVYARHASIQDFEEFWRDHYDWLKDRGYLLRPRYNPGWVASWVGTNDLSPEDCEDYYIPQYLYNVDAIRIQDGKPVLLRRADPPSVSDELKIGRLLSSPELRSDPWNHCVPIYEALEGPKAETQRNIIAVMPFLARWDDAEFNTVGEVVDFCKQMFEGLQFMHNLNIAHNDAKDTNIMMDWSPMYDIPPHGINVAMNANWSGLAKPHSRTTHPVKYYFIDWNLSGHYDPSLGTPMLRPGYGGDQSVPEFKRNEPCNPFAVDVYCMGNVIRRRFVSGWVEAGLSPRRNVEFLQDLIFEMTNDDPSKRPTMNEVASRFEHICRGLSWWKLRSRVSDKRIPFFFHVLYSPIHWVVQLTYIFRRIPAIPAYAK